MERTSARVATGDMLYLYGFVNAGRVQALTAPGTGIDGESPVFVHPHRDIGALVSTVAAELFAGAEAEARLQDPAWVAVHACRHGAVLECARAQAAVFPVRFGTLFSGPAALEQATDTHRDEILRSLASVRGRDEWAVKGFLDRPAAEAALWTRLQTECGDTASSSPGVRHLQEQRLRRQAAKRVNGWLQDTGDALLEQLCAAADDFRARAPLSPPAAPECDMVLNWAFLVSRGNSEAFCARVERAGADLSAFGLRLECTGAWPAYSFCDGQL